jgi:hypothetical protein
VGVKLNLRTIIISDLDVGKVFFTQILHCRPMLSTGGMRTNGGMRRVVWRYTKLFGNYYFFIIRFERH